VTLLRKKAPMTLQYTLNKIEQKPISPQSGAAQAGPAPAPTPEIPTTETLPPPTESPDLTALASERKRYAQTAQDLRKNERQALLAAEKRNSRMRRNVLLDTVQQEQYG
jgi:hypothetical protein